MRLAERTAHTAWCFFQRFFVVESFAKHDRYVVAVAALFLAAKVEDQYPLAYVRRIIDHSRDVLAKFFEHAKESGNPSISALNPEAIFILSLSLSLVPFLCCCCE